MTSPNHTSESTVHAIVLTFNARESVTRCVDALLAQSRPPEHILVVDNGSTQTVADLVGRSPSIEVLRLDDNLGPAGGHAFGLQHFVDSGPRGSWAWVLDDDCLPETNALELLLADADAHGAGVIFPRTVDTQEGAPVVGVGWWGVLIPHAAVVAAGVPEADLFWWIEDTEYLQWRMPRAGYPSRIADDAVVRIERTRPSRAKPAWKYYYEARNTVYYRFRVQRRDTVPDFAKNLTFRTRAWRATRSIGKLAWRSMVVEDRDRMRKFAMVGRGTADGLLGHLGRRVAVSTADRPTGPPAGTR